VKYRNFKRRLMKLADVERDRNGARKSDWDNHTLPLIVTNIKMKPRPCEFACGKQVQNQHIEYQLIDSIWMKKCTICGLWQDPKTGLMEDSKTLRGYFMRKNRHFSTDV